MQGAEHLTGLLVIHPDVRITPVSELAPEIRAQLDSETRVVQTRLRSRTTSRALDSTGAEMLGAFQEPRTLIDAVMDFSARHDLDPKVVLREAYPMLRQFLREGVLVPPDTLDAAPTSASLEPGGPFNVIRCLQVLEDVEVYETRLEDGRGAALKIARLGSNCTLVFEREQKMLRRAAGCRVPDLIDCGVWEDRAYLRLAWIDGLDPLEFARDGPAASRAELSAALVRAYAELHARGIIHGDVHPRNILVGPAGQLTILDFGLARTEPPAADVPAPNRGGNAQYFEPEYARARLEGVRPPASTFRSEQYALAVLVFRLLTGRFPIELPLDQKEAWHAISSAAPRRLSDSGFPADAALEAAVERALAKDPAARHESLEEMAAVLENLARTLRARAAPANGAARQAFVEQIIRRYGWESPLLEGPWPRAPTASVAFGAAGIALMHLRLANVRDDAELLALADAWASKARRESVAEGAFEAPDLELTARTVGLASPLHARSGPSAVAAMVSISRADSDALQRDLDAFMASARAPSAGLDITVGSGSVLLACANIRSLLSASLYEIPNQLDVLGDEILAEIWTRLGQLRPGALEGPGFLGLAHGWAGLAYAALRWSAARGRPPPKVVRHICDDLAGLAEPGGSGIRWPQQANGREAAEFWTGWCHGSAGYVYLWIEAWRQYGDPAYLELARGAGRHTLSNPNAIGQLCCGSTGQAYALLAMHQADPGDGAWLSGAEEFTDKAIAASQSGRLTRHSLYKGEIGTAILAAELGDPGAARFPFFAA